MSVAGDDQVALGGHGSAVVAAIRHPDEVEDVHDRVLGASPATGRHVELASGRQAHVIEAGEGPPLVMVHSGGTSALLFLPLIERLTGVRTIAVDRPGFGLSDPIDFTRDTFRSAVVVWMWEVLDALGLDRPALLGNSMGGAWTLWFTLAHPNRVRRLVLTGAVPMAVGARVPAPLRLMLVPGVESLVNRIAKPSPKSVVQMMGFFGEGETIVEYPDQIEALVAAGSDPLVAQANRAELRAVGSVIAGIRREFRLLPDELARLTVPTLLVWGDADPIGGSSVAQAMTDAIPGARLELLPAAHVPWFAEPDRTAELVAQFVHGSDPADGPAD
jgi:pimeloyl-ACP methyl ester carboxylesterase